MGLVVITKLTHFGERHVRAGNFDVYTSGKFPDSSVSWSLYYGRRKLTDYLGGYAVDPNNADRIVFSSDDKYNGNKSVCGTFLYDATTRRSVLLREWVVVVKRDYHYSTSDSPRSACCRISAHGIFLPLIRTVSGSNASRVT